MRCVPLAAEFTVTIGPIYRHQSVAEAADTVSVGGL
jgi:hypothetical protein